MRTAKAEVSIVVKDKAGVMADLDQIEARVDAILAKMDRLDMALMKAVSDLLDMDTQRMR